MPASGVAGYAAIHARVRILYAHLLTPPQIKVLSEAPGFDTLIEFLEDSPYGPYLERVEEKDLTPRRAVFQIKHRLADAYHTVLQLSPAHTQPLLRQYYRHYEVDNLKAVLRGIVSGATWDQVLFVLFPLGPDSVLPAQAMVETESVASAVELLHGTPYFGTLSHAMERYAAEKTLFPLEVALDLNYWRELWNEVNQLAGEDRAQSRRILGSLLDMTNLIWAIRYRMYHHLSEEEIINYTLPIGYRVRDDDIRAIAAGADVLQVVARLYPDLPDLDVLVQEPRKGLPELEVELQRHVVQQCRAAFLGYPFHISIPLAFLILNEMEIQDLTVLFEAKSSAAPDEGYQPYLIYGTASK
jgi:V/A-type H+-transporting ATPase subunit C